MSIAFLCMMSLTAWGQDKRDKYWYEGELKLMDATHMKGQINYNLRFKVIRINVEGKIQIFNESELESMTIWDDEERHQFLQVASKDDYGEIELTFARLMYQSEEYFSLFHYYDAPIEVSTTDANGNFYAGNRKEDFNKDAYQMYPRRTVKSRQEFKRFIVDYNGNRFSGRRRGILEAYKSWARDINKYVKKHQLSYKNDTHLMLILKHAESLVKGGSD